MLGVPRGDEPACCDCEMYVGECLVPTLKEGDIAIMNNSSCQKAAVVERLVRSAGAEVRYPQTNGKIER